MPEIDLDAVARSIGDTLIESLKESGERLRDEWEPHAESVARGAAMMTKWHAANPDDAQLEKDLAHIRAQARLVAAGIAVDGARHVERIIGDVLTVAMRVLKRAIMAAL